MGTSFVSSRVEHISEVEGQSLKLHIKMASKQPPRLEQSDQGLHCLSFHLHLLDALLYGKTTLFKF